MRPAIVKLNVGKKEFPVFGGIFPVGRWRLVRHRNPREQGAGLRLVRRKKNEWFQRNARLYLGSVAIESLAHGAFGVVQGLYIIALGLDETVLGLILSGRMLATAVASLPAGIISDKIGRKPVLIVGGILTTVGYLGMALSSSPLSMVIYSCIIGISQACRETSGAPLLAESSTPKDRARLFGVNFSIGNFVGMAGSLFGGAMPKQLAWLGQITAFRLSLAVFATITLLGVLPTYKMKKMQGIDGELSAADVAIPATDLDAKDELATDLDGETSFSGSKKFFYGAAGEIKSLFSIVKGEGVGNLLMYTILIGFGAGLVVPFSNVFLSGKLRIDIALVGMILSFNHGATALAGLITPYLAEKYGKIKTVVGTQLASIPFLLLIALPPNIYLVSIALFIRSALMNMSSPVASNFSMEIVPPNQRGKISSLMRISDNIARALSAVAAGYIMSRWNYEIPYFFTAILYFGASMLYWRSFKDYQ